MPGHELAMMLRSAYLAMHRRCDAHFAGAGVTTDQFVVLSALAEEDALTQQVLVARTSSDPNTLRAMLVLLERRQLVERRAHPTDGRARSVSLTPRGRRVFRKLWNGSESVRRLLISPFATGEADELIRSLKKVVAVMETPPPANTSRRAQAAACEVAPLGEVRE